MSIILTEFPSTNFEGSAAANSRWNAVHQPIIFGGQRQDIQIISVIIDKDTARIKTPFGVALAAGLDVGHTIYLQSGNNNITLTVITLGPYYITVSKQFLVPSWGGFINLITARRNYVVETMVLGVDDSNVYYKVGLIDSKPGADGRFKISINGFLKNTAEFKDKLQDYRTFTDRANPLAKLNKKMVYEGSRFNIIYRETWVGYDGTFGTPSYTTVYYWTNSVKQLQDPYNTNMADHVPFFTKDKAKFLTNFDKPTYFPGFPFSLSFIYSEKIISHDIIVQEDYYENGVITSNNTTHLDSSMAPAVNRLCLYGGYPTTVKELDIYLLDNGTQPIEYVNEHYVDNGYHETQLNPPLISLPPGGLQLPE